ncbi:MAG: fructosamine kinase family protein [Bacteroidota bacterium]
MHDIQNTLISIAEKLGFSFQNYQAISGGDISEAYWLKTKEQDLFVKLNNAPFAQKMFALEQEGLETIARTQIIKVPKVFLTGKVKELAFLAMEFIPSKHPNEQDFYHLGTKLAALHQCSNSAFGFSKNNFIGKLPQSNQQHDRWSTFYVKERLLPQFRLAVDQNLLITKELPSEERLLHFFDTHLPAVKPSLLHGDLWSGNYLISEVGEPYLIDPATYYGDRMVDIAMSKLFGGFGATFYQAYHAVFPKASNFDLRVDLYQLYYLLVHLNLFGKSYYGSVSRLLKRYF